MYQLVKWSLVSVCHSQVFPSMASDEESNNKMDSNINPLCVSYANGHGNRGTPIFHLFLFCFYVREAD